MDLARGMAETVAEEMPTPAAIAACHWLPDTELAVYTAENQRTGFQGGLQWYRANAGGKSNLDLELYSGRTIDVLTSRGIQFAPDVTGTSDSS